MREWADMLEALTRRAEALGPSHTDPEAFHIAKSELVSDMRKLTKSIRAEHPSEESAGPVPRDNPRGDRGAFAAGRILHSDGRVIVAEFGNRRGRPSAAG
jgi:hypothetical protein